MPGPQVGSCDCHCCDPCETGLPEPVAPLYPGQPRVTRVFDDADGSHVFTLETLELGCTASVTVSSLGSERRLQIDVTPATERWLAASLFWDDSGATYNPHEGGSISSLQAAACLRWFDFRAALEPDENGLPLLAFGPVIEWEGNRYFFWHTGGPLPPADRCGAPMRAIAGDAASWNAWALRHPLPSEGWAGIDAVAPCERGLLPDVLTQEVNPRRMGRAEDWLARIDDVAGDFDLEHRPDLSFHPTDSKPITRFGFYVGLISFRPGYTAGEGTTESQSVDLVLDRPGCSFATWGVRQLGQTADAAEWPADQPTPTVTVLDDPLTTIPAGWPQFALQRSDASAQPGTTFSGSFTDTPGYVSLTDIGLDDEYPSQVLQSTVTLPKSWPQWDDEDFLRVSWTHRQFEPNQSQCNPPDGRTANNWSCGVSVWPFCRVTLRRDVANILDGLQGIGFNYSDCGANNVELSTAYDVNHGDIAIPEQQLELPPMYGSPPHDGYSYPQTKHHAFLEHVGCGLAQQQYGLAFPSDGDRIEITIRNRYSRARLQELLDQLDANKAANPDYHPPAVASWPQYRALVMVQIQGRPIEFFTQYQTGVDSATWHGAFADASDVIRLGLCGWAGGGWSDLKVEFAQ
ncbi:MAG: hypothetical protein ACYTGL_13800 [Planctomycetota bacterium]|jgi:hypothetical protein